MCRRAWKEEEEEEENDDDDDDDDAVADKKKRHLVENRVSSLECESRTCAKPAFTAKLPFSASVLPLILSLFVFPPRVSSQNELDWCA